MSIVLQGSKMVPDMGLLKQKPSEWSYLQNIRGLKKGIGKRLGVQTMAVVSSSVMGVFELKIEGDPQSPDKYLIITRNGEFITYDPSELVSTGFTYLFASGIKLNLQSPNSTWYSMAPESASSPARVYTQIATPASTTSSDLSILQSEKWGFLDSSGTWRYYVESGSMRHQRLPILASSTTYSTAISFTTGSGPVFQDSNLRRYRLRVANGGGEELIEV